MHHTNCEHEHYHHLPPTNEDRRELRLYILAFLLSLFAGILEIGVRYGISGSVSLLGDAIHGISDGLTYGLFALVLIIIKYRPEQKLLWTIVGVCFSFVLLFAGDCLVFIEAVERYFVPREVLGWWTFFTALISFGLNIFVMWMILKIPKKDHNIRHDSVLFHAKSDMWVSIGVIGSSVIIALTDWYSADWIMAFVIAFYLLFLLCALGIRIARGDWKIGHEHSHHKNE